MLGVCSASPVLPGWLIDMSEQMLVAAGWKVQELAHYMKASIY